MPGDPQIISVQNWLNTTYGWHSQWVAAPTHGFTGWETIYALTRALQIELNITTLADAESSRSWSNTPGSHPPR
jgi:hypothetical protein